MISSFSAIYSPANRADTSSLLVFTMMSYLFSSIDSLEKIISETRFQEEIINNLIKFSELYKPTFEYGQDLKKIENHIIALDEKIENLNSIKKQLMKLRILKI